MAKAALSIDSRRRAGVAAEAAALARDPAYVAEATDVTALMGRLRLA